MQSEGPYRITNRNYWWHVDGLGEEQRLNQWAYKIGAEWWAIKLNTAYAEGRKSAEKDFQELLEFTGRKLYRDGDRADFIAWKKARGIE